MTKKPLQTIRLSTKAELLNLFQKYDFRDPLGHPLVNCQEFLDLVDLNFAQEVSVDQIEVVSPTIIPPEKHDHLEIFCKLPDPFGFRACLGIHLDRQRLRDLGYKEPFEFRLQYAGQDAQS